MNVRLSLAPGLASALLSALPAGAAERTAYVLRIEGPDVFVDLGASDGVASGGRVRIFREVEARHPVTGKALRDRFALGEAEVVETGRTLSRLHAPVDLLGRIEVGDSVEPSDRPRSPPVPKPEGGGREAPAPICPPGPPSEVEPLKAWWLRVHDLAPTARPGAWEEYLAAHPGSDLAPAIRREIAMLRAIPAIAPEAPSPPARPATRLVTSAPSRLVQGDPLEVTAAIVSGPTPVATTLFWRLHGEPAYRSVHLAPAGDAILRGGLAPGEAKEPGVDWFVEAVGEDGEVRPVAGSAASPNGVEVTRVTDADPVEKRDRSRVRFHYDFVDFNKFVGNDQFHVVEGDFQYRVWGVLHAVRLGFGTYQGVGAPRIELDTSLGQPVGFHYGYAELELRVTEAFAAIVRTLAGVNRNGLRGGVEGRLRIGREEGISLVLGGAFTAEIGERATLALAWDAVRGWPMSAEVVVTDEPIGRDLGVRIVYSVGRRVADFIDVSARVGYELRDINHYGFSFGIGPSFHW